MKASSDRVIVRPAENNYERKMGSIVLPPSALKDCCIGQVVAVGPGPSGPMGTTPITVRVGDTVMYRLDYVTQYPVEDVVFHCLQEHFLIILS